MILRIALVAACMSSAAASPVPENLRPGNLVAWCIVPFDAAGRGPEARARMVRELGLRHVAYDWRREHVPSFEAEILAYRNHGITFTAFWAGHDSAFPLFVEHGIRPEIWVTCPSPEAGSDAEKTVAAAATLRPLAEKARDAGCRLGLYNHGGWGGEPAHLIAVCARLREDGFAGTGIVYNLHHAHHRAGDFAGDLRALTPYLLCLNLNGTNPEGTPKILPFGQGAVDAQILATLLSSAYRGTIGILDHRSDTDAEVALQANLDGLDRLLRAAGYEAAPAPTDPTPSGRPPNQTPDDQR